MARLAKEEERLRQEMIAALKLRKVEKAAYRWDALREERGALAWAYRKALGSLLSALGLMGRRAVALERTDDRMVDLMAEISDSLPNQPDWADRPLGTRNACWRASK